MLQIGQVELGTPVMLAPMAGVTNPPFRQLCREFAQQAWQDLGFSFTPGRTSGTYAPTGLYTCEMITTRALVEGNAETLNMVQPDLADPVRSVQLYGVEPAVVGAAVKILVEQELADHIDLNFGCPVPKVTRKGGGSALPWKYDLFTEVVEQAVRAAEVASKTREHIVPVTAKIRIGIDDTHQTFQEVAKIAENAGIAALTLHSRTTEQHYAGSARWEVIKELKELVQIPVFGNGDVFEAEDAANMRTQTGCDGVVVGRGCQGRPWIFYDLLAQAHGSEARYRPDFGQVAKIIMRHAQLLVVHLGSEERAVREMRKHITWYIRGFAVGGDLRNELALVTSLEDLEYKLAQLDLGQSYPESAQGKRGRAGSPKPPRLPEHWLESHILNAEQRAKIQEAELGISGG